MNDPNNDLESGSGGDSPRPLYPSMDEMESPGTMNLTQLRSLLGPSSKTDSYPTGITSAPAISSSLHIPSNPHPQMTYLTRASPEPTSEDLDLEPFSSQPETFRARIRAYPPLSLVLRYHHARLKSALKSAYASIFFAGSTPLCDMDLPALPPSILFESKSLTGSPSGSTSSCNAIAVDLPEPAIPTSELFWSKTSASSKLNIHRSLGTCYPYRGTYGGIIQPNNSHHIWDLLPKSQFVSADKNPEELRRLKEQRERALNPPQSQITRVAVHLPRRLSLSFITLNILIFLIVLVIGAYFWSQRTHQ